MTKPEAPWKGTDHEWRSFLAEQRVVVRWEVRSLGTTDMVLHSEDVGQLVGLVNAEGIAANVAILGLDKHGVTIARVDACDGRSYEKPPRVEEDA